MTAGRHRAAPVRRRRRRYVPVVAAVGLTAAVVGTAVVVPGQAIDRDADAALTGSPLALSLANASAVPFDAKTLARSAPSLSRSAKRQVVPELPKVTGHEVMTADLNVWSTPFEAGRPLTVLDAGTSVAVTGQRRRGFAEIVRGDVTRWVNEAYLSTGQPLTSAAGISYAPCPDGSSTEYRLTPGAVRLYRAVCNAFPALTTYGGWAARGEHASGKAIDFMTNGDAALGQAIADWARAHASELDLYDVIWEQHIWTPERASEGWRLMPNRGSPTANHMDHVHISVN